MRIEQSHVSTTTTIDFTATLTSILLHPHTHISLWTYWSHQSKLFKIPPLHQNLQSLIIMCYEHAIKYTCGHVWPQQPCERIVGYCGRAIKRHAECGTLTLDHRPVRERCMSCVYQDEEDQKSGRTKEKESWRNRADSLEVQVERPCASRSRTVG